MLTITPPWRASSLRYRRSCTTAPEKSSTGEPLQRYSTSSYTHSNKTVLQRPIELRQYGSLVFGQRLTRSGIVGSMGSKGDAYDNAAMESFFATLQTELLDRPRKVLNWRTPAEVFNEQLHSLQQDGVATTD